MDQEQTRQFVALLGQHERRLNAYVLSLAPRWDDADEIVQQTRIRLWEQFAEYDPEKDFGAWARTIAYYKVLTHRKRQSRQSWQLSEDVLAQLAETAAASSSCDLDPRTHALADCLTHLSDQQRELLRRCYAGCESLEQVAAGLGRSYGALRTKLYRLRLTLHECIERTLQAERDA